MRLRLTLGLVTVGVVGFVFLKETTRQTTLPLALFGTMSRSPIFSCLKLQHTRVSDNCLASESLKPDGYGYFEIAEGERRIILGTTNAGYFRSERVELNAVVNSISVTIASRGASYFSEVADSLSLLPLFRCSYQNIPVGVQFECFSIRRGERVAAQLFTQPRGDSGVVVLQENVGPWKAMFKRW